jgi:hypothetical protein
MDPITLLHQHTFEQRLAASRTPARRHLAELRQRRAEARRRELVGFARSLRPARRRTPTLEPCGC